jgi:hypothetical protein
MIRCLGKQFRSSHRTKAFQKTHALHRKYADVRHEGQFGKLEMSLRNTDAGDWFAAEAGDIPK